MEEGEQPDLLPFYHKAGNSPFFPPRRSLQNNTFFIPKSVNISLPALMNLFNLFFFGGTLCCQSIVFRFDSGSKLWTLLSSLGQSATGSCHFQYRVSVKIICDYFICLLRACQHSRQPKNTDLGKGKLFHKYHYTGFIDG